METKTIKILNLYAGIGGNRKLWTGDIEVTAVENVPEIAKIYQDFFPNDKVIVTDAHQFLLEHFKEFDFIWSSPPCPSHSRINTMLVNGRGFKAKFPDMKLYEEILFLQAYFKGKWIVENVRSFYTPLIKPQERGRHYYWSNFEIGYLGKSKKVRNDKGSILSLKMKDREMVVSDFKDYKGDKRTLINNCVEPIVGLLIFEMAFKKPQKTLLEQKGGLNSSQA
ncbi:MAG: DNA cytosine methyltransferase [Candidatus Pacearchaeota archaeon]|jgi:DNA (cytosine-5)-methyltransferase 1